MNSGFIVAVTRFAWITNRWLSLREGNVSRVRVYCGNYVGEPYWHGLEVFEPDECDAELTVAVHPDEIDFASYECPGCGATNRIRDHEVTDYSAGVELVSPRGRQPE